MRLGKEECRDCSAETVPPYKEMFDGETFLGVARVYEHLQLRNQSSARHRFKCLLGPSSLREILEEATSLVPR